MGEAAGVAVLIIVMTTCSMGSRGSADVHALQAQSAPNINIRPNERSERMASGKALMVW
ncbi:MAG: hypothetical protein QXP27_00945 [Candidatus Methanomethyliaceae archaeon]